ncbi:MAG: adenosylcobalamin-dependent ribonucleoside-diphosphate reductase [Candidatus Micrarchaeota archaeon]
MEERKTAYFNVPAGGEAMTSNGNTHIGKIRKRDGRIVEFKKGMIVSALWKAAKAVGGKDKALASALADTVVDQMEKLFGEGATPGVEDVQDIVEKVLIEGGYAKTAKAYIIYRQQRAELREEKKRVLEKEEIDEVDKRFDLNALKVLKARYLRKSEDGKLIETPKQLFTRIAVHSTLPNIIYDERVFDLKAGQKVAPHEEFDTATHEFKYSIGKYLLNRYHLEALKRMFDRMNKLHQMRMPFSKFMELFATGTFAVHEKEMDGNYDVMVSRKFMPNTPAIANFGNSLGMGSACFVIGVEDSIESIMEGLKNTAIVFKSGGGMGYNFSQLRPEGDFVSSTSGIASGPISFMRLFDTMTEVIKQGGIRRGANMGILNSNHPDIEKFVKAKEGNRALRNFNISVLLMPDFWQYYDKNEPYPLVNPRSGETVRTINPRRLFDMIVYQAWESAEPGVIFYDSVNRYNPFLDHLGPIVTTNPCGEVLLYPYESCNLGSINVWHFAKEDELGKTYFDWEGLKETILQTTELLDNVIDVSKHPLQQFEDMTLATRKIGLGLMGFGDLLYEMRIAYNSDEGRGFAEKLMEFINYWSKVGSIELAKKRGSLPYYNKSFYPEGKLPLSGAYAANKELDWDKIAQDVKKYGVRNGYTTVIAPTGSISMIAGCSSGIEPVYALVFEKNVKVGSFYYVDGAFEKAMKDEGLYDEKLMAEINDSGGNIQSVSYIPPSLKKVFVTAMDISPEDHIRMLAAFQNWTDSSISKTNNFPADATVDDMRESYLLAYRLGCKDVTVFRDTSIKDQVLVAPPKKVVASTTVQATHSAGKETSMGSGIGAGREATMGANMAKGANGHSSANGNSNIPQGSTHSQKQTMTITADSLLEKHEAAYKVMSDGGSSLPQAGPQMHTGFSEVNFGDKGITQCPACTSQQLEKKEGCLTCADCGWGYCSS